jgi:branched-chain amino acid transport system substrate-binding protein
MKTVSSGCLALLFILALVAPVRTWAADAYEINAILSLTGGGAFIGKKEAQALTIAEGVINKDGGINGRPVKFTTLDDQTNPQVAVQLLNTILDKKPTVFLGSTIAAMCKAQQAVVERSATVVQYCLSTAIDPPPGYTYAIAMSSRGVVAAYLKFFRARNWTKIGVLNSTDASGQDFERDLTAALAAGAGGPGMTIVANEHFSPADITVAAQLAKIKAAAPQVIVSFTPGTPFGMVLQNIHDAGIDLPVAGSGANMTFAQMAQYERFLPKELYFNAVRGVVTESGNGPVQKAQARFLDAYKAAGQVPELGDTIAWDAAFVVVDALRHGGANPTAQTLRDYIDKQRAWPGIYGSYDFAGIKQRGLDERAVIVYKWDPAVKAFTAMNKPGEL